MVACRRSQPELGALMWLQMQNNKFFPLRHPSVLWPLQKCLQQWRLKNNNRRTSSGLPRQQNIIQGPSTARASSTVSLNIWELVQPRAWLGLLQTGSAKALWWQKGGNPGVLRQKECLALLIQAMLHHFPTKPYKKALNPFCFPRGMLPPALPNTFLLQIAKELPQNELALAANWGMTDDTWEDSPEKHKTEDFIFPCGTASLSFAFQGCSLKSSWGSSSEKWQRSQHATQEWQERGINPVPAKVTGAGEGGTGYRAKPVIHTKERNQSKALWYGVRSWFFPHTKKSETLPCSSSKWKINAFSWRHWIPAYLVPTNERLF